MECLFSGIELCIENQSDTAGEQSKASGEGAGRKKGGLTTSRDTGAVSVRRLGIMKNSVLQRSFLSPMLLNIYISDLPETERKYGYADDLVTLLQRPPCKEMEMGVNKKMTILLEYIRNWCLQVSVGKSVSAASHLNNIDAKRERVANGTCLLIIFAQCSSKLQITLACASTGC